MTKTLTKTIKGILYIPLSTPTTNRKWGYADAKKNRLGLEQLKSGRCPASSAVSAGEKRARTSIWVLRAHHHTISLILQVLFGNFMDRRLNFPKQKQDFCNHDLSHRSVPSRGSVRRRGKTRVEITSDAFCELQYQEVNLYKISQLPQITLHLFLSNLDLKKDTADTQQSAQCIHGTDVSWPELSMGIK